MALRIPRRDVRIPPHRQFWNALNVWNHDRDQVRKIEPPVEWIERNVWDPTTVNTATWDYSDARLLNLQPFQRRIIEKFLEIDATGRLKYRTVLWGQPKKSGKTQIAAAVGAWFSSQVDPPNVVICAANDREQAAGRIFLGMAATLQRVITGRFPIAPGSTPSVVLPNGTQVKAIPRNFEGEAGATYGLTLWSELWAVTSERGRRLYEELIPVPTRKNSMRWVETYAGYENESDLLLDLFKKFFTDTSETELAIGARPVPGLEDIVTTDAEGNERPACIERPGEASVCFWDHEHRMPWQQGPFGQQYYREVAGDLREEAQARLIYNRWQKSENTFLPTGWWKRSAENEDGSPKVTGEDLSEPFVLAVDGAIRHDCIAMVGVRPVYYSDPQDKHKRIVRYRTVYVKVWNPQGEDFDLDAHVGAEILSLHNRGLILGAVHYDPMQLHQTMMNLRKHKILAIEFSQSSTRVKADTFLFDCYKKGLIENYDDETLRSHIENARAKEVGKERTELFIEKGTGEQAKPIDAAVAQSMAVYRASQLKPVKRKVGRVI